MSPWRVPNLSSAETRGGAGDAVDRKAGVALEVAQGDRGQVTEDAVDPPGVESEGAQTLLELGHVVAPEHGGPAVEEAIAKLGPASTRADQVCGPQTPSTRRPRRYWKASTAARVPCS